MAEDGTTTGARAALPRHGGNLEYAAQHYGNPDGGWLDLSTGINPTPYPAPMATASDLARLPGPDRLMALTDAARRAYAVAEGVPVLAVPGTELAIRLLPLVAPSGAVAVVGPTYASHGDAWRNADRAPMLAESITAAADGASIVIVGNPNNPDGRTVAPSELVAVAHALGDRGGLLIVDEAFADVAPEVSLVPHLNGLAAVVLRSFGKFYGLAGLRLGFVAGTPAVVLRLASLLGDWPVSTPAIVAGQAALADAAWRDDTRRRLKHDAARLRVLLDRHRFSVAGGTELFVLVEDGDAHAIHQALARRGIWTRVFDYQPRWLRVGLPPQEGFDRLDRTLLEMRRRII